MTRTWQYKVVRAGAQAAWESQLDELGREGFELAEVVKTTEKGPTLFVLKRPTEEQPSAVG